MQIAKKKSKCFSFSLVKLSKEDKVRLGVLLHLCVLVISAKLEKGDLFRKEKKNTYLQYCTIQGAICWSRFKSRVFAFPILDVHSV